ncbi:MAG: tRNA (adenosine(37)-N6)-threonylcarbamoyltransferase complex dimerization subunit type 1 TsaB, partial [Bacilli bacterium]
DVRVHEEKIKAVLSTRGITNRDHMSMSRAANYFYCAQSKEVSDAHTIVPQYLRLAEAEAKWIEENNKSK